MVDGLPDVQLVDPFRGVEFRRAEIARLLALRVRAREYDHTGAHFGKELDGDVSKASYPYNSDSVCWADVVRLDDVENGRAA
jgi:hypothetical protein